MHYSDYRIHTTPGIPGNTEDMSGKLWKFILYSACPKTSFPNVSIGNPCLYLSKNTGFPPEACGNDAKKVVSGQTLYS